MNTDSQWSKQEVWSCMCDSVVARCQSLLAKELDVRSVLQGKVHLAAVNQIYVVHEALNGCTNLKIH